MTYDKETVEALAKALIDLATREATTMPPGWPNAHKTYSDASDALRAMQARIEVLEGALRTIRDRSEKCMASSHFPAHRITLAHKSNAASARAALSEEEEG